MSRELFPGQPGEGRSKPELLLSARQCGQCLMSRQRVVSGERAAEIIRDCRARGTHFQCHKGTIAGINLHCRGYHDRFGSQAAQFAERLGIAIREIDPEAL